MRILKTAAGLGFCIVFLFVIGAAQRTPSPQQPASILAYIKASWKMLTRSNQNLAVAAVDPKFHPAEDGRWPVYVAADESLASIEKRLRDEMKPAEFRKIVLRQLPNHIPEQGLLYLPHPYVVPGGRFNEMYGWDSYFIQVGLLRDNETVLAKNLADNFLYEIRHYGKILNANRTYYLTRSQPPFLTQMLLGVYKKTGDRQWLAASIPEIEKYYAFWTTEPHLTKQTGLSRYIDLGDGPAPEVVSAEKDAQGRNHYELLQDYFRTHTIPDYDAAQYFETKTNRVTDLFYKGDRSMRESGFDPSNRFGPFNIDVIHYDPVCLNVLLYLMEQQTAEILTTVGRGSEASVWNTRARKRADQINRLMWDDKAGLYFDYEYVHSRTRTYPFLTTFYPLWAGIASKEQAGKVVANLKVFEQPGGLQTSTFQSSNQWDKPFGWAPLQMIAVQGLRRYGYNREADRISVEFLSLVRKEFERTGVIVEKYDVERQGTDVSEDIKFGYRSNEIGFGWTNAVYTTLFDPLPPAKQAELR